MKDEDFKKCLSLGEKYEKEFCNVIEMERYEKKKGKFSAYDIKYWNKGHEYLVEVKSDTMTHKSNNIAIEFMSFDKPSGISVTKAKWYAYFEIIDDKEMKYNLYVIPTNYIKTAIEKERYHKKTNGGYRYLSKMYLFHKNIFKDFLLIENH